MVLYRGRRPDVGPCIVERIEDGKREPLNLRLGECNHSPDGWEWGYGGSGPAQLAYALLRDVLPDDADLAYELHQSFKWRYVSRIEADEWVIDAYDINQWIYRQLDDVRWGLVA